MKRICKRPVRIDALTMCFSVKKPHHYEKLKTIEIGQKYDLGDFQITRVDGRYYNNIYSIHYFDNDETKEFGQLKFNLNHGREENNCHVDGSPKVWITINNAILYTSDFFFLDFIATTLGLIVHNITTLDICLDTPFCVSTILKRYLKDSSITTILNGKRITDRDEDRPEISRSVSGSLNKDKYITYYIKQRKAIKDKSRGITITTYDKEAEIRNISEKDYILKFYNRPKKLFRTEVHLNNEDIRDYLEAHTVELSYWTVDHRNSILEEMFFYFLNSVIRFSEGKSSIKWERILGRI